MNVPDEVTEAVSQTGDDKPAETQTEDTPEGAESTDDAPSESTDDK
jgi:hypothetical protein